MLFLGGSEARESQGGRQLVIGALVGGGPASLWVAFSVPGRPADPRPTLRERHRGLVKAILELT